MNTLLDFENLTLLQSSLRKSSYLSTCTNTNMDTGDETEATISNNLNKLLKLFKPCDMILNNSFSVFSIKKSSNLKLNS